MNHLKSIGIIGGAGPDAGALLFRQIVRICQKNYGCRNDHDFPLINLISFPFSDMLVNPDYNKIQSELKWVYTQLQCDYVVIACNTLHSFLDETFSPPRFLHLIKETQDSLTTVPLLLCTSTSKKASIHQKFFRCLYPIDKQQNEVDSIIDEILKGNLNKSVSTRLKRVIEHFPSSEVILGCTELSLIHDVIPLDFPNRKIVDPSWVVANKLCKLVFDQE